jgi:Tfp pilus assembly protein PilN
MINLLPQNQREEFLQEKRAKIIFVLGFLLLFFVFFLAVLFFSIKIYLTGENQNQKFLLEQTNVLITDPKYKELETEIIKNNKLISQLNEFYKNQTNIVNVLENISNLLPEGVNLTSFSYQKESNQVSLQGKAQTRDSLLIFKKALESQPEIKNLNSPISNLIKSANIDYYFSFNLSDK